MIQSSVYWSSFRSLYSAVYEQIVVFTVKSRGLRIPTFEKNQLIFHFYSRNKISV